MTDSSASGAAVRTAESAPAGSATERLVGALPRPVRALHASLSASGSEARSARQAIGVFALRGISAGIAYMSQVLLARWMGGGEYGVFVSVWAWLLIMGMLSSLGLSITVQRFVHGARAEGDEALLRGVILGTRAISFALSSGLMLAGLAALWLGRDLIDPIYLVPGVLVLVCLPMFAMTDLHDGMSRSFDWMDLAVVPPYIWRPLGLLACVGLFSLTGAEQTAVTAAAAAVVATWVTCLVQFALLHRRLKRHVAPGARVYRTREWVRISLPVLFSDSFGFLLLNADVLILTVLRPPEEVAIYFAATRTISLVAFIAYAVAAASGPRFAEASAIGDARALRALVTRSVAWTLWPSLGAAGFVLLFGHAILGLFGPQFEAGYAPMALLAVGFLIRASVGSSERLLNMAGAERACAVVYIVSVTINVALNFMLIPAHGLMGAAAATVAALSVEAVGLEILLRRRFGVSVTSGWTPAAVLTRIG